ncbi:dithiol-disulfide isomerase involved in polyketide biosynthesis [Acinetobacter baumannii]|uniref:DsbA family oxidoreductase n=1 Tax=Acinetobacter baumannii TaxID=470 RepID=A0AAP1W698_ACIBA|nr:MULTISPECIES: DsbA family oxidoreductase [Acinetobacter]EHU1961296.1 DsbA family oxidoreductase [Acinetobacter baumannii]EKU9950999.1 DsbA family oxidoreductase [Acinetobacter baumannii]EKX3722021.1 DsbA family oxidoreductase [Acinetobacter baumannii]EKX3752862.1 DsbA family oxidoreductase [Acinetobacter baumannii]EXE88211.1 DSBA-like thioredoxin domain protein [Acinetobacter baumannii 532279]
MKTLPSQITVDIWSDFVCPWCWIAKKRFEKGLDAFEHKNQVTIQYHSYRLANGLTPQPFKDALYKKFGGKSGADAMMSHVKSAGELEGLIYNFNGMLFGDTLDAHAIVKLAQQKGVGELLTEKFFKASITEGKSIFDHKVLVELANEVGVPREEANSAFSNISFKQEVLKDEASAHAMGASGVPLFIINNKYSISGAQPVETFLSALEQVWEEKQNELMITEGQSCGINGCSI